MIDWLATEKQITVADAMRELGDNNGDSAPTSKPRIVATYDYVSESGKLLFQVCRLLPKSFRQRRPDPTKPGAWLWKVGDVRRVLFKLPQVIGAETVVVFEGEKDVLAAESFGITGTTSAGGAGKWLPSYSDTLTGKAVIICGDTDEPGRKHVEQVARSLHGKAASVRVATVPAPSRDFNDFVETFQDQEQAAAAVRALLESAAPWTPAATAPAPASATGTDWPAPAPLPEDLPPVPAFNFDCLPSSLRPWLADIAERMQCPPDFPAVAATVALGSLVGRKIGIRPKRYDDWLVVPNIWGAIVGRPGLMKTPAAEQALVPLRRLVAEALKEYEGKLADHKAESLIQSQRRKLSERKIADALKDGDETAAREEARASTRADDSEPTLRRYEVNDSTVAKLGELLAENPNGLLVHRDELIGLLRGLDKEGSEEARAFYLEAWAGTGSFTFDRIGRGTVRVESNTLAILGGIQPDLLCSYVREAVRGGIGADGLLQRFQLAVWPDVSKQWRNVDRWPDTTAKNEAFAVFKYLAEFDPAEIGADVSSGIPFLRFAPDAQDRFDRWRAQLETKLRDDSEHPAFEAHLSKYRKLVPALALLIHLADRGTGHVTRAALDRALLWAVYLEQHARRIYSAVLRPDAAAARELGKHLQRGELGARFTLREVYRRGWAGLSSKEDAEGATEILCDANWIRPTADDPDRQRGRPASPVFEVSPRLVEATQNRTDRTDTNNSVSSVSAIDSVLSDSSSSPELENTPLPELTELTQTTERPPAPLELPFNPLPEAVTSDTLHL